jgi:anhydro-N-acetylmuramic acid kinase
MSGTSLDGIDAVLVEFSSEHSIGRQVAQHYEPYSPDLRATLLNLHTSGEDELHRASLTGIELADHYAACVNAIISKHDITPIAIACHGQTIRHRPECGYSLQLVNAARLVEKTGMTVICDFRNRDIAAGGQGAPLTPAFHAAAFSHPARHRVIVNIGGIANLTCLPAQGKINGFDCGPGNLLLDAWCHAHTGQNFDRDGAWGAQGRVLPELLTQLQAHPFFNLPPPKSAGREQFNLEWLHSFVSERDQPQDVQATLVQLTAHGIINAVEQQRPHAQDIFLCGGGAHNIALVESLKKLAPQYQFFNTDALGISADWLEAHAFAWLGWQTLQGKPSNRPEVTGAAHTCVLGAIYPA